MIVIYSSADDSIDTQPGLDLQVNPSVISLFMSVSQIVALLVAISSLSIAVFTEAIF